MSGIGCQGRGTRLSPEVALTANTRHATYDFEDVSATSFTTVEFSLSKWNFKFQSTIFQIFFCPAESYHPDLYDVIDLHAKDSSHRNEVVDGRHVPACSDHINAWHGYFPLSCWL